MKYKGLRNQTMVSGATPVLKSARAARNRGIIRKSILTVETPISNIQVAPAPIEQSLETLPSSEVPPTEEIK